MHDDVLGMPVKLCPVEETIWSKAFVQERERFDGADVAHLIRARGWELDWRRLLRRFGPYWQVLFSHLILFGFIYPGERGCVPDWLMNELWRRTRREMDHPPAHDRICQGTLLSREQYLTDIVDWGYVDARLHPRVNMSAGDIEQWTAAIEEEPSDHDQRNGHGAPGGGG